MISSLFLLPPSKEEQKIAELESKIEQLRKELNALVERVARIPQPIRANWSRKSAPYSAETLVDQPAVKQAQPARPKLILPAARKPKISRVTIEMSPITPKGEQRVTSYDQNGNRMDEYSGLFCDIGLTVMTIAGNIEWELIPLAS